MCVRYNTKYRYTELCGLLTKQSIWIYLLLSLISFADEYCFRWRSNYGAPYSDSDKMAQQMCKFPIPIGIIGIVRGLLLNKFRNGSDVVCPHISATGRPSVGLQCPTTSCAFFLHISCLCQQQQRLIWELLHIIVGYRLSVNSLGIIQFQ